MRASVGLPLALSIERLPLQLIVGFESKEGSRSFHRRTNCGKRTERELEMELLEFFEGRVD